MLNFRWVGGRGGNRWGIVSMSLTVVLRTIERVTQTKCLTCECEIILSVFYNPNVSAGHLFGLSRYSSTTFYGTLKRLTDSGVVICRTDPNDRRSNVYCLNDRCHEEIGSVVRSVPDLLQDHPST